MSKTWRSVARTASDRPETSDSNEDKRELAECVSDDMVSDAVFGGCRMEWMDGLNGGKGWSDADGIH